MVFLDGGGGDATCAKYDGLKMAFCLRSLFGVILEGPVENVECQSSEDGLLAVLRPKLSAFSL